MRKLFEYFTRFLLIRYLMSGGIGAAVHLGILYILAHVLGVWYLLATSIAFVIALGVSFTLQKFWTFQDTRITEIKKQGAVYALVSTCNFVLNGFLMYVFVDHFGLIPIVAQIFTSALIAIEAYVAYSYIFELTRTASVPEEPGPISS